MALTRLLCAVARLAGLRPGVRAPRVEPWTTEWRTDKPVKP